MRKSAVILTLLFTTSALAARLDAPSRRTVFDPVESPRKAKVLRDALAAFTLSDGSQWVTHFVPAAREPGAIGVTRFGADGSAHVFLVSDWLPRGSIPRGWCGQVYGVGLLDDGRVIASAGWTDGRNSHNGIFILRPGEDGRYVTDKLIEVPGVRHVVGGPRNTILAVTFDANLRGGGPLFTLYASDSGKRVGTLILAQDQSPVEAAQKAGNARLQRINAQTFAAYEPTVELVYVFDLEVVASETILSPRRVLFVGDDAVTVSAPVVGIEAWEDGDLLVARSGRVRGTVGTQLTIYGRDHSVRQSLTLDRPWHLMLREESRILGVVRRREVELDPVAVLRGDHPDR